MKINDLCTPAFLLDVEVMNANINNYQKICTQNNIELWPMTKTHKSTYIAKQQIKSGTSNFLAGTLKEVEKLIEIGAKRIVYAYPLASEANFKKAISFLDKVDFIFSIDNVVQGKMLNDLLIANNEKAKYLITVNSGLNRFGVLPKDISELQNNLNKFENIEFLGIQTHPGQVYGCSDEKQVENCVIEEKNAMEMAIENLVNIGFTPEIVASGSSPTFKSSCKNNKMINVQRPGNYVFFDRIQQSLGACTFKECALTVLATIVSNPSEGLYIIDAGSKAFGLDQGAHGVSNVVGFGYCKEYPNVIITSLSEEVGKIKADPKEGLKIGQKLRFITNHSCSTANLADKFTLINDDEIVGFEYNDMK